MSTTRRVNVTLDEEHAQRLAALAKRSHVQEGTLARSLLSHAIDMAVFDADTASLTEMLDRIEGLSERLQLAEEQVRRGEGIPLDQL